MPTHRNKQKQYKNFIIPVLGIVFAAKELTSTDEQAARESTYQEAVQKYPLDIYKYTCNDLDIVRKNLQLEIDAYIAKKAQDGSSGNERIQNRYIDGYQRRLNEIESMYNTNNCAEIKKQQEREQFLREQQQQLEQVQKLATTTSKTSKYIIWGMLGLIVVVSGVIIIKKISD